MFVNYGYMRLLTIILVACVCCLPAASAWGQGQLSLYEEPKAALGFKAGLGFTGVHGSDVEALIGRDVGGKWGFIGGAFARVRLSNHVSFQPEVLYTIKGVRREGVLIDTVSKLPQYGTIKTQLTYLEIPLLIRWRLHYGPGLAPAVYGGPVFSFSQTAKITFEDITEVAIDESVTGTDIGLAVGGSLDVPYGTGFITIDVRYTIGLQSIDGSGFDRKAYNHALSFMAGFVFPLKRPI